MHGSPTRKRGLIAATLIPLADASGSHSVSPALKQIPPLHQRNHLPIGHRPLVHPEPAIRMHPLDPPPPYDLRRRFNSPRHQKNFRWMTLMLQKPEHASPRSTRPFRPPSSARTREAPSAEPPRPSPSPKPTCGRFVGCHLHVEGRCTTHTTECSSNEGQNWQIGAEEGSTPWAVQRQRCTVQVLR